MLILEHPDPDPGRVPAGWRTGSAVRLAVEARSGGLAQTCLSMSAFLGGNAVGEFGKRRHKRRVCASRRFPVRGFSYSNYNNFALDQATVAACPIQIDYARLTMGIAHAKSPRTERHCP